MKILVISDSHNQNDALKAALVQGKNEGCEAIIFCGDSSSPETFSILIDDGRPLYAVLGNIEENPEETQKFAQNSQHVTFDPDVLSFSLDNRRIGLTHYPTKAEELAKSGKYDAVFHGHTHKVRNEMLGKTTIGNPGEIIGRISGKKTIGIYNTATGDFSILPLVENPQP